MIGGGNVGSLKPLIEELKIEDSVIHLGVRSDIPELLQAGDVYICPSLYEGFPGTVLEAETTGLNCVISDTITNEVMLTKNIVMLSLDEGPSKWAEAACKIKDVDRKLSCEVIRNSGYDINSLVSKTGQFFDKELRTDD